ncbi:hypothetical protein BDK51DRAFT_27511, partial [Blyttiomyces helicus]
MQISGKVAIVTGSSSGFGKALAIRLGAKGAKLVLGDIDVKNGQAYADALDKQYPGKVVFARCDVSRKEDVKSLFELAKSKFGSIDIVINNAGIPETSIFHEDATDAWEKVIDIDLTAVIYGTRLALTEMIAAGKGGVIVNTASLAGLVPVYFQPVYAAAKAGVVNFTRSLVRFGRTHNIHVNAVCPGFSPTGILAKGEKLHGEKVFRDTTQALVPVETVIDAFVMAIEEG